MRKNINEPKSKKLNPQNKLKKVLYPRNSKPITFETYIGINNQKEYKKNEISEKKEADEIKISSNPPPPKSKLNDCPLKLKLPPLPNGFPPAKGSPEAPPTPA